MARLVNIAYCPECRASQRRPVVVVLLDQDEREQGKYCRTHGMQKLAELQRAEQRQAQIWRAG